jgi:hypothetical protein
VGFLDQAAAHQVQPVSNQPNTSKSLFTPDHAWGKSINKHFHAAHAQNTLVVNKIHAPQTQPNACIDSTTSPQVSEKISKVLGNLGLQLKKTRGDGHCLLHAVIESYREQIFHESDLHIEELINKAKQEINQNMRYYLDFMALNDEGSDLILSYMEKYFTHKKYDHPLGDLMPTVLSNALGLQIIVIREVNADNVEPLLAIRPENHEHQNDISKEIYIHLKGEHYSALVPLLNTPKSHQNNKRPNQSNLSNNRFTPLYDAPDTCINAEDESDDIHENSNFIANTRKVNSNSDLSHHNLHNTSRSM